MLRDQVIRERNEKGEIPSQFLESSSIGDFRPARPSATRKARRLKQAAIICTFAAIVVLVVSSLVGKGEAAGSPPKPAASIEAASFSAPQGKTKFDHAKHNQLKCDQCHVRRADAIVPVMPGHGACISCHIKEFISTQFGICTNCHEGITAVQPPVLDFPERQSFGVEFSHKTHATYQAGEKRADCSSCHAVAGARTTFPAHRECYVCHKAPDQVKPGERAGGASCGECHTASGDRKPPSVMGRAYSFRFGHSVHVQRAQCSECHKVGEGAVAQVSLPLVQEHRVAASTQSCGACHNGRRAFSGEQGPGCSCNKCHVKDLVHSCM